MVDKVKAFDHMIKAGLYQYHCDPWSGDPQRIHYKELEGRQGQVDYRGETFIVSHQGGRSGRGGMDEGSPASVTAVYRVKK